METSKTGMLMIQLHPGMSWKMHLLVVIMVGPNTVGYEIMFSGVVVVDSGVAIAPLRLRTLGQECSSQSATVLSSGLSWNSSSLVAGMKGCPDFSYQYHNCRCSTVLGVLLRYYPFYTGGLVVKQVAWLHGSAS